MNWIDRWARRMADQPSPRPDESSDVPGSRRDFLRRAAVIGATAWTIPVLQSVAAPAHAASGPCSQGICGTGAGCPLCEPGVTCVVDAECVTQRCSGGTCQLGLLGDPCTTSSHCGQGICSGGVCVQGATGTPCDAGVDCVTGICSGGVCQAGGIGTPCATTADCTTGQCFGRTGGVRTCGGPGAPCAAASGCTHGNCAGGTCGGFLAGCSSSAQCAGTRVCVFGIACV